ncbi:MULTISPECIES: hypothetical protein [Bacillus cereus group]|uniref:Uncharacterized protein n=1 Tax=Bacillus thuringiensis TaxID=1428 RepID=A0A9X6WID6_BACTU|nr:MULTISPECIES: hypothetical protein [Bacillus cereus group]MDA1675493.1 hypothetical protein [Bacillus cereus group sp. TH152-1LC]PFJ33208.1 hypothetical protein COJ15_28615 [Bacillus thuringiensis]
MKTKKMIIGALTLGVTISYLTGCTQSYDKPVVVNAAELELNQEEQKKMQNLREFNQFSKGWDKGEIEKRNHFAENNFGFAMDDLLILALNKNIGTYEQFLLANTGTFVYTEESKEKSQKILKPIFDLKNELPKQFPESNPLSREWEYDDTLKLEHLEGQEYKYSQKIAYANEDGPDAKIIHFEISGTVFYNYVNLQPQFKEIKLKQLD